jgi:hypothetical protein
VIGYIPILASLGLPLALGLLFRVSASHLFFSVMAGELLARYFGLDASTLADSVVQNQSLVAYSDVIILTLPVVLTAILLRGTLKRAQAILHIIPLAITGLVFASFLLPLLPITLQEQIQSNRIGNELLHMNGVIIGSVVIAQLGALWVLNRHKHQKRKRNKE